MSANPSFKTILIGDRNVGKTHLSIRFLDNSFGPRVETTINCIFLQKMLELNGRKVRLEIWDTAGEERYSDLAPIYYRNAVGAILVYDITRRESFENLGKWLSKAREKGNPNIFIILLGNKSDLEEERVVSYDEGEDFAKENGLVFLETSCKTGENVKEAFMKMAKSINEKLETGVLDENEIPGGRAAARQEPRIPENERGNCAC